VILAKTVKGYGMGKVGEGKNTTHQQKKLTDEAVREFRDRFNIPILTTSWRGAILSSPPRTAPSSSTFMRDARGAGRLPAAAARLERRTFQGARAGAFEQV
jgi:pyruvate dehydrogenase E1 component